MSSCVIQLHLNGVFHPNHISVKVKHLLSINVCVWMWLSVMGLLSFLIEFNTSFHLFSTYFLLSGRHIADTREEKKSVAFCPRCECEVCEQTCKSKAGGQTLQ